MSRRPPLLNRTATPPVSSNSFGVKIGTILLSIGGGEVESALPVGHVGKSLVLFGAAVMLLSILGCITLEPVAGPPLISACLGECGQSLATQVLITNSGPATGCPYPQCNLQLKISEESDLCANESIHVIAHNDDVLMWDKTYSLDGGVSGADSVEPGYVDLIVGAVLHPGDVVTVKAQIVDNENQISCKREGNMQFEVILLH